MSAEPGLAERRRALTAALLSLDHAPETELEAARLVRGGLGPDVVATLERAGLAKHAIRRIVPPRTLEHRRQRGERLTVEESERAYRAGSVLALAEAVFGDRDRAIAWLSAPRRRFDGESAFDLLDTEAGGRLVEEVLIQVDEGYFA